MVPKRIASAIMNSLKGDCSKVGLGYIAVGREKEIDALLSDIDVVQNGGASFRFIVGNTEVERASLTDRGHMP